MFFPAPSIVWGHRQGGRGQAGGSGQACDGGAGHAAGEGGEVEGRGRRSDEEEMLMMILMNNLIMLVMEDYSTVLPCDNNLKGMTDYTAGPCWLVKTEIVTDWSVLWGRCARYSTDQ